MLCILMKGLVCVYDHCKYYSAADNECMYVKNKKQALDRAYVRSLLKEKKKAK